MSETEHRLQVLIANERDDRLETITAIVEGMGHEIVGKRVDMWAQMITFTEVAALAAAVSLVATILKQKAPGMGLARMPIFVWATLVTSLMVIFSMPSVALASGMLLSDRLVRVWDLRTGVQVRTVKGHRGDVAAVAFSPDGTLLASADSGGNGEYLAVRRGPIST